MRFVGLANYFADFIDHFADIARPLHSVLRAEGFSKRKRPGSKLVIADWDARRDEAQIKAWIDIKDTLSALEVLVPPTRSSPRRMPTNASGHRLGGVLLQRCDNSSWRPV